MASSPNVQSKIHAVMRTVFTFFFLIYSIMNTLLVKQHNYIHNPLLYILSP